MSASARTGSPASRWGKSSIRNGSIERGGIEADLTVTRIGELEFLIVTSAACQTRDFAWLKSHIGSARAYATDVTSGYAVLGLMGPRSRAVLSELTSCRPIE